MTAIWHCFTQVTSCQAMTVTVTQQLMSVLMVILSTYPDSVLIKMEAISTSSSLTAVALIRLGIVHPITVTDNSHVLSAQSSLTIGLDAYL